MGVGFYRQELGGVLVLEKDLRWTIPPNTYGSGRRSSVLFTFSGKAEATRGYCLTLETTPILCQV